MTIILDLPPDIEAQVYEEALQEGLPLPDYIVTVLRQKQSPALENISGYLMSESALANVWMLPEEDVAWQHL
jgi:hypothetical protein